MLENEAFAIFLTKQQKFMKQKKYPQKMALYSCSPIRVSKELPTVYESVSCLQQLILLRARFVLFILMPAPSIN